MNELEVQIIFNVNNIPPIEREGAVEALLERLGLSVGNELDNMTVEHVEVYD